MRPSKGNFKTLCTSIVVPQILDKVLTNFLECFFEKSSFSIVVKKADFGRLYFRIGGMTLICKLIAKISPGKSAMRLLKERCWTTSLTSKWVEIWTHP